jgi:hypothetical protein
MNVTVTRLLRALLFISVLFVFGFKGDACICGGRKYRGEPPAAAQSAEPSASGSAAPK